MINVREQITTVTAERETILRKRQASVAAAYHRIAILQEALEWLENEVNKTDITNTGEALENAYKHLTDAFRSVMDEEKRITK